MEYISNLLSPFLERIGSFFPNVIGALLVLILGWLVIAIVRKGVLRVLSFARIDERIAKVTERSMEIERLTANILYYLLLIFLFLLVLEILQVQGVLDPVIGMFNRFLEAIPNILAALLIGLIGFILAKIVGRAVEAVATPVDTLTATGGMPEKFKLSRLLGQIVFLFIFVPTLIAALDALAIRAISEPARNMLDVFMSAIPNIVAAAIILAVAYYLGKFVTGMLTNLLKNLGADNLPAALGLGNILGEKTSLSEVVGKVVYFFILLFALTSALNRLGLYEGAGITMQLTYFFGSVLLGLIIIAVGHFLANLAHRALSEAEGISATVAQIVRFAILGLVLALGLRAMGFANEIVSLAFALVLGALAVAFALAFGLGGREAAGRLASRWVERLEASKNPPPPPPQR
ncbi:MAG: hypothetical protein EA425_00920 [Puniceicoccaceae bacterium]|nr:MAG: hypothetical protein EA425_00920 [Puniceicoccaceae bacterium]